MKFKKTPAKRNCYIDCYIDCYIIVTQVLFSPVGHSRPNVRPHISTLWGLARPPLQEGSTSSHRGSCPSPSPGAICQWQCPPARHLRWGTDVRCSGHSQVKRVPGVLKINAHFNLLSNRHSPPPNFNAGIDVWGSWSAWRFIKNAQNVNSRPVPIPPQP